jgi:hypothetical protein
MKEIVVTNGLRVRSEGIAVTVTASMLLTTASGYLALKNPFKRKLCTLFCNLHSRARTHAVFVIGLYELLGNPTN